MNNWRFITFFTTLMGVYACLHIYAGFRGLAYLHSDPWLGFIFTSLMLFLFLSYPLGRFLERYWLNGLSEAMVTAGAFWMAAIVYLFIALIAAQVATIFLPALRPAADVLAVTTTLVVMVWGHWNATHSKVTFLEIQLAKKSPAFPSEGLRLVVISDIHMGTVFNRARMETLVNEINALKPDLVLFPGDMLDEDLKPVVKGDLGAYLPRIQSRFGLFSSTGNHEFIGGVEPGTAYLRRHGIRVLRDESVLINDSLYVVGREDAASARFGGSPGKPLSAILDGLDKTKPIILLDHSPVRLAEAVREGIDLSLSGHTHHGQFWPWNLITTRIYEISRGYLLKASTHFVVSNGYGTWGPPVRIGSRSEIVFITLRVS